MATDARNHSAPAAGEIPSRASIDALSLTVNDVVFAASAAAQTTFAAAMSSAGYPASTSNPLVTLRGDAPGLHRIEYSPDGTVWLPASGALHFTTTTARDTWTSSYSSYLSAGDTCQVGTSTYTWDGAEWNANDTGWTAATLVNSWVNFGGAYVTARYRRLNGWVQIEGVVKSGSVTSGTTIFTLPAGFLPSAQLLRPTQANSAFATIQVTAAGAVQCAAVPSNASLTLDMSFPADA
jgi:hypothetical protein